MAVTRSGKASKASKIVKPSPSRPKKQSPPKGDPAAQRLLRQLEIDGNAALKGEAAPVRTGKVYKVAGARWQDVERYVIHLQAVADGSEVYRRRQHASSRRESREAYG